MVHTINPSFQEVEAGRFLSSRPAWSKSNFQDCQGYTEKACFEESSSSTTKPKILDSDSSPITAPDYSEVPCCPYLCWALMAHGLKSILRCVVCIKYIPDFNIHHQNLSRCKVLYRLALKILTFPSFIYFCCSFVLVFGFFEAGMLCVALAVPELTLKTGLVSNSGIHLSLPSTGVTGMCHRAQLVLTFVCTKRKEMCYYKPRYGLYLLSPARFSHSPWK